MNRSLLRDYFDSLIGYPALIIQWHLRELTIYFRPTIELNTLTLNLISELAQLKSGCLIDSRIDHNTHSIVLLFGEDKNE